MHFSSSWMFINESPWLSQNYHCTVISSLSFKKVPFGRSDLNFISFFQLSCKSFPAPELPTVHQTSPPGAWLWIGIGTAVQSHGPTKQFQTISIPGQTIPNNSCTWPNHTKQILYLAKPCQAIFIPGQAIKKFYQTQQSTAFPLHWNLTKACIEIAVVVLTAEFPQL